MIRFYGHPISDNARKVHWALEELGISYEMITIDLFKGEHRGAAFLEKNPLGRIPILEDGDLRLFESAAILWYLGERYGAGTLLPLALDDRARAHQWLSFQTSHYGRTLELPWRMKIVSPILGEPHDDETQRALCKDAEPWLNRLDAHLERREYVVGSGFTIADIALAEPTTLADQAGIDLARWPAVKDWLERVSQRPSFAKTR